MKKYWEIIKGYKKSLLLSPLLVLVMVLCETAQPMFMARIVDHGVMQGDLSYILHTGMYMVLISVLSLGVSVGNMYVSSYASVGFGTDLRGALFHRIQEFSFPDIDLFSPASLITQLTNDITKIQLVILMSLRTLLRSPLMLVMALFFVLRINKDLGWILLVSIPVLAVSLYLILRSAFPYFVIVQQKLDQLNEVVRENLTNIRLVKSFVREDFEIGKFERSSEELRDMVIRTSNMVITAFPILQLVMNFSILAVLWFGGRKVINSQLQVGELIAVVNYLAQILFSLMMLSMIIMTAARASASSERVLEVLNKEPSLTNTPEGLRNTSRVERGEVIFKRVDFRYQDGETDVLHEINFEARPGETIAVVGATGSAKTSLVQLIPHLYDVTGGQILIDGRDVRDYNLDVLHQGVGVVLKKNVLLSWTIEDNMRWGKEDASYEEMEEAAQAAEAHDFIMSLADGYDTILERGGSNLSGGQKQRICIARSLLRKPKVLILDDSTSAVDTETELKIRTNLNRMLEDTTVFIITQRLNTMQSADRVMILEDGQILALGRPADLMETSEVYREIYNSQQLTV
ncbi:MAG: ABC transporter ATP-binding protein/permease [Tannerellaceae bacterium]|nr:ABC transporter ATP-binding protein/permease [Tannerellaceae bacterium]